MKEKCLLYTLIWFIYIHFLKLNFNMQHLMADSNPLQLLTSVGLHTERLKDWYVLGFFELPFIRTISFIDSIGQ